MFSHTQSAKGVSLLFSRRARARACASVRRESSRICLQHVNSNLTSCGNGTAEGRKICSAGKTLSFGKKTGTVHGPNLTGVKRDGGKRRRRQKTVLCKPVVEAKPHIRKRGKEPKPHLEWNRGFIKKPLSPGSNVSLPEFPLGPLWIVLTRIKFHSNSLGVIPH